MIKSAKALSYEAMSELVHSQSRLLAENSFICIAQPELFGPRTEGWPEDSDRWLNIFFEDVRPEHISILPELERQFERSIKVFDESMADRIIEFLIRCHARPTEEKLIVNCSAGISRSGAIVSFAAEIFDIDKQQFRQENASIAPNGMVLYLLRERWNLRSSVLENPRSKYLYRAS